jgi:hypothetical protein
MVNCPKGRKIDMVLSGSESIQLAKDRALRFWLALYSLRDE